MRIGLFAHRSAQRHPTGIGRYLREFVCALAEVADDRYDLVLASTREPERPSWVPRRVETAVLPWPRRPVQAAWCLGAGPKLERSLGHLDVAYLIQPFPPVSTVAPQVVMVHDLFPFEHPAWYPRSERWTYRRSMELVLRRGKRIVVPSEYVADRLAVMLDIAPGRVDVVPHGVSGTFAHVQSDDAPAAICARFGIEPGGFAVCVGAMSTRKNVIALIRAIAELPGEKPPLVMVGPDGHGVETVQGEINRLDGAVRLLRTGYLSDDDTAALVRAAAVLVHPALAEGFGLVPLEAMAAGTPVIAARAASIPEVVGEAAVLVDEPTMPKAWADALAHVLGSTERRKELVASGRRRAATFSWEQAAITMLEIFRDVARS